MFVSRLFREWAFHALLNRWITYAVESVPG